MTFRLSRRSFLRGALATGATIAIPLPRLDCMLNGSGTAYASGAPLTKRFGTWFFGNGILKDRWVPTATGVGDAWQLSEQLAPLAAHKSHLSVVTGLSIKSPQFGLAHADPAMGILTGATLQASTVAAPTIDQHMARALGAGSAFPSGIHVGVSDAGPGANEAVYYNISFNGPNAPNAPQNDPRALFRQLVGLSGGSVGTVDSSFGLRANVLDAAVADMRKLRARVGAADKARLDQHLTGIEELQTRLAAMAQPKSCAPPTEPTVREVTDKTAPRDVSAVFAAMTAMALSCDLARVFTFMFTRPAAHVWYEDIGLEAQDFHESYGHLLVAPGDPEVGRTGFNKGVIFAMTCYADLLGAFAATPDGGDTTLLDNSAVLATSCISDSVGHGVSDFPLLVGGKLGGTLRGDIHYRSTNNGNTSELPLTLLQAVSASANTYGVGAGMATQGISALLT